MEVENHPTPTIKYTQLFINGQFVDGVKKTTIPVLNPATEEKIADVAEATEEDVEIAIKAAKEAYPGWSGMEPAERGRLLYKLADLIEANLVELAGIEVSFSLK